MNFASSYFDSSSIFDLSNPFESLSSLEDSVVLDSDSNPSSPEPPQPLITSSPKRDNRTVPSIKLSQSGDSWKVKKVEPITLKNKDNNWTIVNKKGCSNPSSNLTSPGLKTQPAVSESVEIDWSKERKQQKPVQKASTTSSSKRNTRPKEKPKQRFQKLTIATVNFQSIKGKVADFAAFLSENSPDIILGSESWLDGTIATAEIFPSHYQVTRKDRNINGGGVLIAINDTIPRIERPDLMSDGSEQIWCQLIIGTENIFIGSYYRPQTAKEDLELLHNSLCKIQDEVKSPYIILGGDFNIPNLDWTEETIVPHGALQDKIMTITDDFAMDQLVVFPTRRDANGTENILDLLFTTRPSQVSDIRPHVPMADHSIVMAEITTCAPVQTKPPRTVYLWSKIDEQAYKQVPKNSRRAS